MNRRTITAGEGASIYLLGVCAGSILNLFLSLVFMRSEATFDGMSVYSWVGYAIIQVAFVLAAVVYDAIRRTDILFVARMSKPRSAKQLFFTPFIAIAAILTFLPLANLWTSFLGVIHYHGAGVGMPDYSNVGVYFLSLFVMAALPAFGEEFLLRGHAFSGLRTRSMGFGVLMSALLFSLMHANPLQTVHQFGIGIVLALVFTITNSLWACVLVHFFNNFISITLTAYLPQVDALYFKLGYFNWLTGAASFIIGLLMLVTLLYAMYKVGNKSKFKVISSGIDYDDYTIYAVGEKNRKNPIKAWADFIASLFTKAGWRRIGSALVECGDADMIGKNQPLLGVWLALGLVSVYWLYSLIVGLL